MPLHLWLALFPATSRALPDYEPFNYSAAGYELRVKDFVDLKNLSDTQPDKHAPANTRDNAESHGLPASPRP